MKPLGWWLMLVGSLRMASVWFGFFDIWALRLAVFSKTTMTEIHGRTFGIWTLLTCTLCFLCAFNLDNKPLYLATFLSFIYAFGHFLTECLIYQTMAIANLTTVGIFAGLVSLLYTRLGPPKNVFLKFLYFYRKLSLRGSTKGFSDN